MKVSLGTVLINKRKEKGITQQQLADFMGVSKTSVSKWENDRAYPDITLLPLLAAYFDSSIDDLLNYEPQLSKEEIQRLYLSLRNAFEEQSSEEVYQSINSFIRRYYSCYPFILQMALLILNHFDRFPGEEPNEKKEKYVEEALQLFIHVKTNSSDPNLVSEATKLEGFCLLLLNRPDEVLGTLGHYIENNIPTDDLIASAYQLKGLQKEADATAQSGIFQNISITIAALTNYTQLVSADYQKFEETVKRAQALITAFEIHEVNPAIFLNNYLSAAVVYAQHGFEEKAYKCLFDVVELLEKHEFQLSFNTNAYFNLIGEWLDQLPLGDHTPRNTYQVIESMSELVLNHPAFDPYRESEEMREISEKIKNMMKRSR
ncbi:helix-turn-helix transcriptional regulator [Marinilactibacillus kalidii]|uniref:helix-turn-helix transcriptional regulator n=1 Tax=Marinilactibacillus kalidii TaxID=2820274 RepID=UPI001ABE0B12|nr:helix-turn-helix transcriptional regulator [Marinilactibacillus kalidii]